MKMPLKSISLPAIALGICMSAQGAAIQLANGDLNSTPTGSGWTTSAGDVYYLSNWTTLTSYGTIGFLMANGSYIQQNLGTSNPGLDASTYGSFTINFDMGYRRDSTTSGDLNLSVALWDTTVGSELSSQTITITNPGVGANSLSGKVANLSYNNSNPTLIGHNIALRITNTSSVVTNWHCTGMVDNFVVTPVPESSIALLGGLGLIGLLRRRR